MSPRAISTARLNWDFLGTAASMLCVVHCVLTPVLLALSPTLATMLPGSTSVHRILIFFVVSLGLLAFVSGSRKHRRSVVLLPMCGGIALVGFGAFGDAYLRSAIAETLVTAAGSVLLMVAHGLNRSFCHSCDKCKEAGDSVKCGE
ncbi:MAG: hypothetical protein JWO91_2984 [Acidobacteriaceae bacterium]|jgi:hypothetical protein|nr:hypothetical protein [Acidobacteriaceae bacterium]